MQMGALIKDSRYVSAKYTHDRCSHPFTPFVSRFHVGSLTRFVEGKTYNIRVPK